MDIEEVQKNLLAPNHASLMCSIRAQDSASRSQPWNEMKEWIQRRLSEVFSFHLGREPVPWEADFWIEQPTAPQPDMASAALNSIMENCRPK